MSHIREGMQPQEGIQVLQHFGYRPKWKLHERFAFYGVRLIERQEGSGEFGHYVEDPETRGDITQWCYWQRGKDRTVGGWAQAWPARITRGLSQAGATVPTKSGGGIVTVDAPNVATGSPGQAGQQPQKPKFKFDPKARPGTVAQAPQTLLPILNNGFVPDKRFASIDAKTVHPKVRFPGGYAGIVLNASDENTQQELFFPADGRLIAVNADGDPSLGSQVCDLDRNSEIDPDRMAPLQSSFRVLKGPSGAFALSGENSIAWNIYTSGRNDRATGFIFDSASDCGALVNHWHSGFMDTGDIRDQHDLGVDADGHRINAAHLSLDSYFRSSDGAFDAPLKHDGGFRGNVRAPIRTEVFFECDNGLTHDFVKGPRRGMHRWTSTAWHDLVTIVPPYTPTTPPRPPTTTDPPPPPPPQGSECGP